jgi:hypothetical protein
MGELELRGHARCVASSICLLSTLVVASAGWAQGTTPGDERWSDAFGLRSDDAVQALAVDGSGTLYVGGSFTTAGGVAAHYVAEWNGSAWSALGSGMDDSVNALAVDGSGNLYVGGSFTTAGGVAAHYVARWNGSAWFALGSGMDDSVNALAVDGSGNLYAGGDFTTAGGVAAQHIARWNGSAWSALGSGMDDCLNALAVDGSGNLYAGGHFATAGGVAANYVARWNGSAWSALDSGTGDCVNALAVDESGNLYAGGMFTAAGGVAAHYVAKWNGSAWSSLGTGVDDYVNALAVDGSGNPYAGGEFETAAGVAARCIAQWNGSAWSALGSGMDDYVNALAVDGSGNLYAGGWFTAAGGKPSDRIGEWEAVSAFSISGVVRDNGAPLSGVTMTLAGVATQIALTDVDGAYEFSGLEAGEYSVTPSMSGYVFDPSSRTVNLNSADVSGQDFTGRRRTDNPTVTMTAHVPTATEAGKKGSFKATRSISTTSPLSVKYVVGGTAANGVDYKKLSGVVVIPAHTRSAFIPVVPIDDAEPEGNETVTVTLSADPDYSVGSPASATVNIRDDEAVLTMTALAPHASEKGQKGYFSVRRTGSARLPLSVKYTVGGTATNGADYKELSGVVVMLANRRSALIPVVPVGDAEPEGTETVIVTLSAGAHYSVGSPASATVYIRDRRRGHHGRIAPTGLGEGPEAKSQQGERAARARRQAWSMTKASNPIAVAEKAEDRRIRLAVLGLRRHGGVK